VGDGVTAVHQRRTTGLTHSVPLHTAGTPRRLETTRYIGRFVDHDDKVSETKLSSAYDLTSRAWTARFGVPYSTCGCHQPNPLAGLGVSIPAPLRFWSKDKETKADRRAKLIEQMVTSMEQGEKDATHPSSHNMVAVGCFHSGRVPSSRMIS
jgi:hypothetical protein